MGSTVAYHIEKHKLSEVNGLQRHDERKKGQKHKNKRIDDSRTDKNIVLKADNRTYKERIESELEARYKAKRKPRSDAVCLVSQTVQFGGLLTNRSEREQIDVLKDCSDYLREYFGEDNTISSVIHLDETNPHLHISYVPLTKDGRLSAKELTSRNNLRKIQKEFLEHLKERFPQYGFDRADEQGRGFANGQTQKDFERLQNEKEQFKQSVSDGLKKLEETKRQIEESDRERVKQKMQLIQREKTLKKQEELFKEKVNDVKNEVSKIKRKQDETDKKLRNKEIVLADKESELYKDIGQLALEREQFKNEQEAKMEAFEKFKAELIEMLEKLFEEAKKTVLARRKMRKLSDKYQPITEENWDDFADDLRSNLESLEDYQKSKELTL